jgi:uncharacterized protein (DUF2236 family)
MTDYFSDSSMFRVVYRERMAAFGGGRAILLQTAHPMVVTGLLGHSLELDAFRRRLMRTQRILETIGFGPRGETDRMMDAVRQMHERVSGRLPSDAGRFAKGTPYSALDPELMLWVLFTMYDSSQLAYETFVRRLSEDERRGFWNDYRLVGRLFGLDDADMPATLADVDAYRTEMLEGDTLHITDWARRRGRQIALEPIVPLVLKPLVASVNFITVGLLPPRIRHMYGFDGFPPDALRNGVVRATGLWVSRFLLPVMPNGVRATPESRGAGEPWRHVEIAKTADGSTILRDAEPEARAVAG